METNLRYLRMVILDIDGVIYCNGGAAPGAAEAIRRIRAMGIVVKFLTNDTVNSRRSRAEKLAAFGLDVDAADLFTAASLTADYLRHLGAPRTMALLRGPCIEDFEGIPLVDHDPDVVVVGDCFASYSFDQLNRAFAAIRNGALFLATHRNRLWSAGHEPTIDVGFWVSGLEYCTRVTAKTIGKPSAKSYRTVCNQAGVPEAMTAMVSDDVSSDLQGAERAGLLTVHMTDYCVAPDSMSVIVPDVVIPNLEQFAALLDSSYL